MLAEDQVQAIKEIKSWWESSRIFHILEGSAGVGKSYVIEEVLKQLKGAEPVLLAPTHKALRQLKDKTNGNHTFRTVASALGIRPIFDHSIDVDFEHKKLAPIWEQVNLGVADEGGMLDNLHIDLFRQTNTKVLFVGHKSQLPPIIKNRSMFDACISPIFEQGFSCSSLWIPKRNTGKLWEHCNYLEKVIYDTSLPARPDYDISKKELKAYIEASADAFSENQVKFALWTNDGVEKYNNIMREIIWKNTALPRYVVGDLVICTSAFTAIKDMEYMNDSMILREASKAEDVYSDTDGKVLSVETVLVSLNRRIQVPCYKLKVLTAEGEILMYEPVNKESIGAIVRYYNAIAFGIPDMKRRDKAFSDKFAIMKAFTSVKHFYASTCHRLQGSSIPSVIVIQSDLNRNANRIERAKCTYVGASRAINELMVYRGI